MQLEREPRRRAPADQEPPPEVKLVRGDTIVPEPISWLWDEWLACRKLHVLAGAPGTGKSTIAFAFAAAVSAGGRWPDGSTAPRGNVLIWSGEDGPADTIMPRLLAAGADPTRIFIVSVTETKGERRPFDPAKDMDSLHYQAQLIGDVCLLIADPIVSAVTGDSHKNTEVRRALQPLVDLGAALNCAVLGISHFSKGTSGRDPTERVTGSIAFAALARIVLATAKPEAEGPRILARAKSNIGPDSDGFEYEIALAEVPGHPEITASRIVWGSAIAGSARELLGTAEEVPDDDRHTDPTPRTQAADWLREVLSDGPIPAQELRKLCAPNGISWRTLHRAREAIGAICYRAGFGRGSKVFWALPGMHATNGEPGTLAHMADGGMYEPEDPESAIHATGATECGKNEQGTAETAIGATEAHSCHLPESGEAGTYGYSADEVLI